MSEWQPARLIRNVHEVEIRPELAARFGFIMKDKQVLEDQFNRIVRVRPVEHMTEHNKRLWRAFGCDSDIFYEVHPDDMQGLKTAICEHEILTD